MNTKKNHFEKRIYDSVVLITIVFTLIFTSVTVSSTMLPNSGSSIDILSNDPNISMKELIRSKSSLPDDVCDDCDDDDDDDTMNKKPEAFIYEVTPNPAFQFQEVHFEGYGEDKDGTISEYRWESDIDDLINTQASFFFADLSSGVHTISFYVRDNLNSWSDPANISLEIMANMAPNSPVIAGDAKGSPSEEAEFHLITSDPEQHDISYYIDWGDGTVKDWFGTYSSNEDVSVTHTWDEKGTYTIRAKAKDVYGAEGEWGSLEVQMPKVHSYPSVLEFIMQHLMQRFPILNQLIQ